MAKKNDNNCTLLLVCKQVWWTFKIKNPECLGHSLWWQVFFSFFTMNFFICVFWNQIKIHNNAKSHALVRTKQSPSINVFTQELFTSNVWVGNLTLRLIKSCCIWTNPFQTAVMGVVCVFHVAIVAIFCWKSTYHT